MTQRYRSNKKRVLNKKEKNKTRRKNLNKTRRKNLNKIRRKKKVNKNTQNKSVNIRRLSNKKQITSICYKNNYSISYLVGPQAVPLDNFSEELVVKLKLSSRSTSEGFRQLEIAIDRGNLIRRVSGLTVGFKEHRFDFLNIKTNQNIPDARFEYDSPPFANVYQNFLYQPEN